MRWFVAITVCLLIVGTKEASAHEHWIDADSFCPAVGETGKIFICSGHSFPKSNTMLKDRVLHNTQIIKPDGKKTVFKTIGGDGLRSGEFVYRTNGAHIVMFELKQPQMKEPLYRATAIVVSGDSDDKKLYAAGAGLEIIPDPKIVALRKGDSLPIIVQYNGKQVNARLSILAEQGKSISMSTTANRPASLSVLHAGRYLVTTSYKGKSGSLTFAVRQSGGKE